MDSLKFHQGTLCPTLLRPAGRSPLKRPYNGRFSGSLPARRAVCGRLLPLGLPRPYAYDDVDKCARCQSTFVCHLMFEAMNRASNVAPHAFKFAHSETKPTHTAIRPHGRMAAWPHGASEVLLSIHSLYSVRQEGNSHPRGSPKLQLTID
jgi:hypothetical protein